MDNNVLDNSIIDRRNILNNQFAISEIQKETQIQGIPYLDDYWLTTQQVADYFEIDTRTIKRYVSEYGTELRESGYRIIEGAELEHLKDVGDINVPNMPISPKAPKTGIFNIRAFLNLAMLLTESPKAKELRRLILNIATETVTRMAGGSTKYINQRDEKYLLASYYNENYNKKLRNALKNHVTDSQDHSKYANYNDKVYQTIFLENARTYKKILALSKQDKARDTMYTEVLTAIASFENTMAALIEDESENLGRALTRQETDELFAKAKDFPAFEPQIEIARRNMASLDNALRNKQHDLLLDYIYPIDKEDYERFLNEKSKELSKRIDDNLEALKRLKDK